MPTPARNLLRVVIPACVAFTAASAQTVAPAAAPASPPGGDETLVLSPFEVRTERDIGYAASAAMSGTRTGEKLENLPNSITVMTGEFLEDLALNTYFDAVNFGVSTENTFNDQGQIGVRVNNRSGNQVNIRGLASVRQLRDGFPWYLVPDAYNTERIEFGRGPGGLAYGDVDAGGSINIMTKRATYQQRGSAQVRYDTFGTQRYSVDFNQPLVPGRLGLRVNAIDSEVEQFRQRAGRELQAYAAALRWEPFKDSRTQIDVLAERGQSTNQVGVLGLIDQSRAYVRGSGTNALDADPVRADVQAAGVGMLQIAAANNAHNALFEIGGTLYSLRSTPTHVYRISAILEGAAAISATDPNNPDRIAVRMAQPPLIALGQDWGGGDNHQSIRYHAYTIELKHAFSDRLNVLVAHNGQFDESLRKGVYSAVSPLNNGNIGARALHIDVNPFLPNPSGPGVIPNPNFQDYFTNHSTFYQPEGHEIVNWRAQAVYDARLPFGITQRVVVAGAYRHEDNYVYSYNLGLDPAEIARRGYTGASASLPNNRVTLVRYIKNGNSDDALRWDERPGVTRFYRNDPNLNRRFDQSLTSGSVSLLGAYFGGKVRTSVGLSREHWVQDVSDSVNDTAGLGDVRFRAADRSLIANDGAARIDPPVFGFDDRWTTNQTYGAVWKALPWLAFTAGYFESSQFSDNYGIDLLGRPSDPLTGEGMDFSARFTLLRERLQVGATYFETKQENLGSAVSAGARDELNPLLRTPFVNLNDYRDLTSQGWEYEVTANLTRNWTLRASWSTLSTIYTRFFPLLEQMLTEARAAAPSRGLNADDATVVTRTFLEDQEGNINRVKRSTGSLASRYTFTEGRLRGLGLGVAARYASGRPRAAVNIAGVAVLPATRTENYIITSPFVSYRRKIGRYQTTLQLNVDNIGDVRSDQGNTWRWQRFTDGRNFITTVTVGF